MRKAYMVTAGDYSDYRVLVVCEREEDAQAYVDVYPREPHTDGVGVEEVSLLEPGDRARVVTVYTAGNAMYWDGPPEVVRMTSDPVLLLPGEPDPKFNATEQVPRKRVRLDVAEEQPLTLEHVIPRFRASGLDRMRVLRSVKDRTRRALAQHGGPCVKVQRDDLD